MDGGTAPRSAQHSNPGRRRAGPLAVVMLAAAALAATTAPSVEAMSSSGGFGGGGARGGGSYGGGSGGGRPSGGGGGFSNPTPASPGGSGRSASWSRPSTGPRSQPRNSAHLIPESMRGGAGARGGPPGRDPRSDVRRLRRDPRLLDPYSSRYYGRSGNPLHYLYTAATADDDPVNPLPPQESARSRWLTMLMYVLVPLILVTGLLIFAGRSIVPRSRTACSSEGSAADWSWAGRTDRLQAKAHGGRRRRPVG